MIENPFDLNSTKNRKEKKRKISTYTGKKLYENPDRQKERASVINFIMTVVYALQSVEFSFRRNRSHHFLSRCLKVVKRYSSKNERLVEDRVQRTSTDGCSPDTACESATADFVTSSVETWLALCVLNLYRSLRHRFPVVFYLLGTVRSVYQSPLSSGSSVIKHGGRTSKEVAVKSMRSRP